MGTFEAIPAETEKIAAEIVDAAIKVHRLLGPGLLESVYEQCLAHELTRRGFVVERQVPISLIFEGKEIEVAYRADLMVNNSSSSNAKPSEKLTPLTANKPSPTSASLTYAWAFSLTSMSCA